MPVEVVMPRLSDTMEEGKVLKWLKAVGEVVEKGEPIAEIETDKAAMELESFDAGTLSKIIVPEGETVPVGEPIAIIAEPTAKPAAPAPREEKPAAPPAPPRATVVLRAEERAPEAAASAERVKASPLARRVAEERGVNLNQVKGTGPDGRITKEDVLTFAEQAAKPVTEEKAPAAPAVRRPEVAQAPAEGAPAAQGQRTIEMTRMQATIAERMAKARQTIPQFYVTSRIEMSQVARMIETLATAGEGDVKIGFNEFIIRASALALRKFPIVNAFFADGKLQYNDRINIGIAVALPEGLMVPVLQDADKKGLREIAVEARRLITSVREGKMAPTDFEGATFTLSNLGMFDIEQFTAIINPPESAIMAIGSVHQAPLVRDGQLTIGETMKVTLSVDHRVFYGATAAQYLQEFKRLLQNPILLIV